jgi:hypothetical protein
MRKCVAINQLSKSKNKSVVVLIVKFKVFSQPDVLQLQEVGDFGDENCLPPQNLIRSTKLHLTTEPPISCRCC